MRSLRGAAIIVLGLALAPAAAEAQERLGDGAMGAVAGAVVAGPVGAVAGGLVGYTVGPNIASAWGLRHPPRAHRPRHSTSRQPQQ